MSEKPKFQQRHYKVIARILDDIRQRPATSIPTWIALTTSFAWLFEYDNSRFNVERFYRACGLHKADIP